MSENGVKKSVDANGRIVLEREHIDVDVNDEKALLWADREWNTVPHVIIENGGVNRTTDVIPNSSVLIGARRAPNDIYGAFSALIYDEANTEYPITRATQEILGGSENDRIFADQFKNGIEIPLVAVKSSTSPNGIIDIQTGDNNYVFALEGDDLVVAGHGNNWVEAGTGADNVKLGNGGNYVDTGDDNDIDVVEVGNGSNYVIGGSGDKMISNGSTLSQFAVFDAAEGSVNTLVHNEPSFTMVTGAESLDLSFGEKGLGYVDVMGSDNIKINFDKDDFAYIAFDYRKTDDNQMRFNLSGVNNDDEYVELGSGFADAVEKITLEYATENDPNPARVEIGVDALAISNEQGRIALER